jgi:hypothetical protein
LPRALRIQPSDRNAAVAAKAAITTTLPLDQAPLNPLTLRHAVQQQFTLVQQALMQPR